VTLNLPALPTPLMMKDVDLLYYKTVGVHFVRRIGKACYMYFSFPKRDFALPGEQK